MKTKIVPKTFVSLFLPKISFLQIFACAESAQPPCMFKILYVIWLHFFIGLD